MLTVRKSLVISTQAPAFKIVLDSYCFNICTFICRESAMLILLPLQWSPYRLMWMKQSSWKCLWNPCLKYNLRTCNVRGILILNYQGDEMLPFHLLKLDGQNTILSRNVKHTQWLHVNMHRSDSSLTRL